MELFSIRIRRTFQLVSTIYYDHSNELVFNWKDYETKVTENDFNKFVSSVNRSLLPAGITFKMK